MTTASELADELERMAATAFAHNLAKACIDNLPTILSALRRVEKMEAAIDEALFQLCTGDTDAARQALTGEA